MLKLWSFLLLPVVQTVKAAMSIGVSNSQATNPASNAVDGNSSTFWHSEYSPVLIPLPYTIYLDTGSSQLLNGFTYLPRQDGKLNGNIGAYSLAVSTDNKTWTTIATSTFQDDASLKSVGFASTQARYIRLNATSEAGNRGNWTNAAEFGFSLAPTAVDGLGEWGPVIIMPLVPAAGFIEYSTGNIWTFSAYSPLTFGIGEYGYTISAVYNPTTGVISSANVSNTEHDMFCPGMSLLFDGAALVSGGDTANKTSIYTPSTDQWVAGPVMQIPRGYHSTATTSAGNVFNIGGSWSGGLGGKNGELYDPIANTWTLLPGCTVAPMLTADAEGAYRTDNHAWLFAWKNGSVFQAGPSKAMDWYGTTGTGSQVAAGLRTSDTDSMCGNAVMYDAVNGKIFTAGGSPDYQDSNATNNIHLITISSPNVAPTVQTLKSMTYKRAFANGVVLPDGHVIVIGGQPYPVPFTDTDAVLTPELWDPTTQTFTILPPHTIPRTYHSIALLMLDGRVFAGGGGLCGSDCATNHADAQIYSPAYLFNSDGTLATRPVISLSTSTIAIGKMVTITTSTTVTHFSITRYGSTTHTVNTDQRRIALTPDTIIGNTYTLTIPANPGIALPGYWMFWAMNSAGVPSVASPLKITL
ncbi:carbohydrate-Binding Module family 32 protein [Sclerotinia borealis F-4128]|uniref:Carbohydrate-Binding Module family 32 protein n=1 Tax=Sclerotinia borealis (strain F-4128) TaxID=1432307 RepID=W9CNW5_SCLBF|nr:carbohydrate-Binding Module family 32 protein [Sclerotinia borealis F-4128]